MSNFTPKRPRINDLHKRMMGDVRPFHSNVYASTAGGKRIGATSVDPFSKRLVVENNRQNVRCYRDAIISQSYGQRTTSSTSEPAPRVLPTTKQSFNSMPQRKSFHEPTERGYNPYS